MNGTAKKIILAAVGVLTVVAAGSWAIALGPLTSTLLLAAGGAVLGGTAMSAVRERREHRLARALQRRDDHLAHTAHELRTPLTAVMNALEIVRAGYATTPEEAEGFLDEADLAARHLLFLINDVVDEAAIEAGKLRLEIREHTVEKLARESLRVLGMQAARNEIMVEVDDGDRELSIRADARRLLQVLFNLVGNAIKFSEQGQPIRILINRHGDDVRFRVIDEGQGVAPAVEPQLFSAFAGDDQESRADSTGLGLHICRNIVEQMGGQIGYSRRPQGSEFWFTLPCAAQATVAPIPAQAQ